MEGNNEIKNVGIGELEKMFFDGKLYDELSDEEKQELKSENEELESSEK